MQVACRENWVLEGHVIELGSELSQELSPLNRRLAVDPHVLLDHTLLLGANECGKTTLGLHLIDRVLDLGHPVLVLDTTGDLTAALMERSGSRLLRGFENDLEPADPRIQLNMIDIPAATAMFARPTFGVAGDEAWAEEGHDIVAALLDLLGYRVRGLTPECALVENLVQHAWDAGRDLSLRDLAAAVLMPPFRRLGIFDLDAVIGPERRSDLAAAIHSLHEAPGFPDDRPSHAIDLRALLTQPDGTAAANVVSFAQRSGEVRRFLAAVLFAKLATFVKYRFNEDQFSMLVLIDEGPALLPPGQRVSTTSALLHMLHSWRQFGVGVALVAEQPHDLHEDALDLAETWLVGRMPLARSRRDVVEELDLVNPPVNEVALDAALKQMAPGQFVLRSLRFEILRYFLADAH